MSIVILYSIVLINLNRVFLESKYFENEFARFIYLFSTATMLLLDITNINLMRKHLTKG